MGATFRTPPTTTAVPGVANPETSSGTTQQLIESVRAIGPSLRDHSDEGERNRRLPAAVHEALIGAGLQRMLAPRSLGGFELDPVSCGRVVEEVARFDSAAAWALQSGNAGAWWSARFAESGVEEIYGRGPDVIIAAGFHPPQQAIEVEGGYRVTGRAPLASNIHDSEWAMFSAIIIDDGRPRMTALGPAMIGFALRTSDIQILDTWYTLGMRGTDSNDAAFRDVFVPAHRAFALVPDFQRGRHFQGPLYRFPATAIIQLFSVGVLMATARSAIGELRELGAKKTPFGSMKTLRDRGSVQSSLAHAEAELRSARAFFYEAMTEAWMRTSAGEPNTLEHRADLLTAAVNAAQSSARVTDTIHRLAGTTGIYANSPLERYFRDAETLRHHGFVSESKLEAAGQIYLGLEPDFPLVFF